MHRPPPGRATEMAVIAHDPSLPTQTHGEVTRDVLATITSKPTKGYYILLGTMAFLTAVLLGTVTLLLKEGLGLAGYAPPIMWSVYILSLIHISEPTRPY